MQIIEFIHTARWIASQYTRETEELILRGTISRLLDVPREARGRLNFSEGLRATHEMVSVADRLTAHPFAREVLRAFQLEALLDKDAIINIAESLISVESQKEGRPLWELLHPLTSQWRLFTSCIDPVEALTIPTEVANEQDFDEILTLELKYSETHTPQAETISKVIQNATKLYESVARASGHEHFPPLLIIFIASGSSFRFDFKGLGEPLKQVKELLIHAWERIRHRKADDFHHNSKAILEGLNLLSQIQASNHQNVLDPETTVRLNQRVVSSMLSLFGEGALPREVKSLEVISNQKLMQGLQQKLLPPAALDETNRQEAKTTTAPKKRSTKPQKRKHSTGSGQSSET